MTATNPLLRFEGHQARLIFDRPGKHNAIDSATWRAIPELVERALQRSETRIIVVEGAGGTFAAGADIGEFDTLFADRDATLAYLDTMIAATRALANAEVPVIALINGLCIGAGVAVALSCDLRIASDAASFAVTPAKLGLTYSFTDVRRLVDAVGVSAAKDLLFTGRTIGATEALTIRLVDAVHPAADLRHLVNEKAESMAVLSAWSHSRSKALVNLILSGAEEPEQSRAWFADAVEDSDYREGMKAFYRRRAPIFSSR